MVTCSPVERSISNSLRLGFLLIDSAKQFKSSVVCPIAETTTTTSFPASLLWQMLLAIFLIFLISPTEVPPNFFTVKPYLNHNVNS